MIAVSTHSQTGTLALAVDTYPSATVWPNSHGTAILITFRARLLRAETKASVLDNPKPQQPLTGVAPGSPSGGWRNHQRQADGIDGNRTQHDAAPNEQQPSGSSKAGMIR